MVGWHRRVVLTGLGVFAGAVLPGALAAQLPVRRDTVPIRRDTSSVGRDTARARTNPMPSARDTIAVPLPARADSMIRNDSIAQGILGAKDRRRLDTLKAPLARAAAPPVLEIGEARIYDRAAIFATGALTLSDLLARVPGLTGLATGWTLAPTAVASLGDLRRIRLFLDGLELDPMDQRAQGLAPITDLPLHTLEELRIERGADEVRVHARTWRVISTTPTTRADVLTGDQNTNLYRGWFGRRYAHGEALQVSAQQTSTQPNSSVPSTDGQSYMLRVGIANGPWSADLTALRSGANRDRWVGQGNLIQLTDSIAPWNANRTTAYLRLANGDPDAGRWAQLIASSHSWHGTARGLNGDTLSAHDSTSYESQYLLTGGIRRGLLRASAAERIRVARHETSAVPSVRANLESGALAVSVLGEGKSPLDPARLEGIARVSLLGRVALLAAASHTGGGIFQRVLAPNASGPTYHLDGSLTDGPLGPLPYDSATVSRYEVAPATHRRAEAGIHVRDLWLSLGLLQRGATTLLPAAGLDSIYGRALAIRSEGTATARTAAVRGRLWRAINVDAWALAWGDSTGLYRPRYQTRAELYLQTNLLDRFPHGNFGLLASLAHEYRSSTRFATPSDSVRTARGYRTLDFRLEIRIQTAVVSYQFRNVLQENYAQVPGFFMPRQTQFYGVRWDFFN
jgi:hypothetical protein